MNCPRVLIVEDEPTLADLMRDYLRQAGMEVAILSEGTEAVEIILRDRPDLVVLDLMLPGKDGLTICREVRATSNVPIIMETAKVEEIDRLLGLELGADDYLCKPFSPRELVARVKAILRRTSSLDARGIVLEHDRWQASLNGLTLDLTRREFQVLSVLHRRPGRVYSRDQILDLAFPDDADVMDRTIDSHIRNIRTKIRNIAPEEDPIRSVYGVGYAFGD